MLLGVSDLLQTWPSEANKFPATKTPSSPYSDYDDDGWGSEFSSNVLDYTGGTPDARSYPVNNSFDRSTMSRSLDRSQPPDFNPSYAAGASGGGKLQPRDISQLGKSKSFRNFFTRAKVGDVLRFSIICRADKDILNL